MIKFGTDGWRAVIAREFTFENVNVLSQAIADYLSSKGGPCVRPIKKQKKVVIGYDTRFLSEEFAQAAALVLAANQIKVVLSDKAVPTPAVSFHCLYHKYDLGIMITASHNPASFNGLKIKTKEGGSADKPVTDAIEKFLYKSKPKAISLADARKKNILKTEDLTREVVSFLRKFIDLPKIQKLKLKVLVDTMYGAADDFVGRVLGESAIKIDYLHNEVNPSFGGVNPEPVENNVKELIARVKKEKYDLGLALDGDGDRLAMVDNNGNYINAQVLLPLLAIHMIKNKGFKPGIGKTVVGSNMIDDVSLSLCAVCYEMPVGFKYLSNLFKDNLICVGGEEAGGIGVEGYIPERDGSAAFLLILEMLAWEKKSFSQVLSGLYKKYGRWYYSRCSVPVASVKKDLKDLKIPGRLYGKKVERINTLDGIKIITKDNWLMFRKSGTEPIVRVYAESRSQPESQRLISLGRKMIYDL